jgi:hypothetical protein
LVLFGLLGLLDLLVLFGLLGLLDLLVLFSLWFLLQTKKYFETSMITKHPQPSAHAQFDIYFIIKN